LCQQLARTENSLTIHCHSIHIYCQLTAGAKFTLTSRSERPVYKADSKAKSQETTRVDSCEAKAGPSEATQIHRDSAYQKLATVSRERHRNLNSPVLTPESSPDIEPVTDITPGCRHEPAASGRGSALERQAGESTMKTRHYLKCLLIVLAATNRPRPTSSLEWFRLAKQHPVVMRDW
jgi:hypothetical protein